MTKPRQLNPAILKAVVCEDSVADDRIFASYCLYFDRVFVPVCIEKTYPRFDSPAPPKSIEEGTFGRHATFVHHPVYERWKALSDVMVFPALERYGGSFSGPMFDEIVYVSGKRAAQQGGFAGLSDLGTYVMCLYHDWTGKTEHSAEGVFVTQHHEFRNEHFLRAYNPKGLRRDAEWLASTLALKAIQMVLPAAGNIAPDEVRALREKLEDVLVPFRMSMLQMTRDLRGYISDPAADLKDIDAEAEFLVLSTIRPKLYEIRMKIRKHNDSLLRKIFGSALKVLGLGGKFALLPSPGTAMDLAQGVGHEALDVGGVAQGRKSDMTSGLMFLSRIEDHFED